MSGRVQIGWTPAQRQATGVLWLRGDSIIFDASNNIIAWFDKFGKQVNFLPQGTPPLFSYSQTLGGQPVMTKIASGYVNSSASYTVNQPNTIYVVASSNNPSNNFYLFDSTTAEQALIYTSGNVWAMTAGSTLSSSAATKGAHVFCCVFNGPNSALYVDSSSVPVTGNAGTNNVTATNLYIGTSSGGATTHFIGDYAEIIVVKGADNQAQVQQMFGYFHSQYSLLGVG
jgi:hypothetical protein